MSPSLSVITPQKAELYEKYRLPYPPQLADDLLSRLGQVQVIADIGAGTGQLARLFASHCPQLYAIEPDPAMRAVATRALAPLPTVQVRAGSAEQTALPDKSVGLIVVGNAFHRFRPEACQEFRRILNKSGWIALVSYNFTSPAFTNLLFSKLATLPALATRIDRAWRTASLPDLFGEAPIDTLRYPQSHQQNWFAFFGSACSGIEAPERDDDEFAQFEAINRQVFDTFAVAGQIQMDYETQVSLGQPSPP